MIYLSDFTPFNCPCCGRSRKWDYQSRSDFFSGASLKCDCGVMYQYVNTDSLIQASTLEPCGDLSKYASEVAH